MTSDEAENTNIMIDTMNASAIQVSPEKEEYRFFFDDVLIEDLPIEFEMHPENEDLQEPCLFIDRSATGGDNIEFNIYEFLSAKEQDEGVYFIKSNNESHKDIEYTIHIIPTE